MMKFSDLTGWSLGFTLFFLSSTLSAVEQPSQTFYRFESFSYSEPQSVKDALTDWGESFDGGERQWAWNRLELGYRYQGFEFSLVQRADYDLRLNDDAVKLWGKIDRKEPLAPGQTTEVDVEANVFRAFGFRLGYRHTWDNLELGGGLTLLRANYLVQGDLRGQITTLAEKDFDFSAEVDYQYSEDILFDRPGIERPVGLGYSLDLHGQWQVSPKWQLGLEMQDLLARIHWKKAPFTEARAGSDRKSYDENGYAELDPVLNGYESYRSHRQHLSPRVLLSSDYRVHGSFSALVDVRHQYDHSLYAVGVGYQWHQNNRLQARYWLEAGAIELSWCWDNLGVKLAVDDWRLDETRTLWLGLTYGL